MLDTFTPPLLQASNSSCTSTQVLMKAYQLEPTGSLMILRFRASASGNNGTIVGIDDVSIN